MIRCRTFFSSGDCRRSGAMAAAAAIASAPPLVTSAGTSERCAAEVTAKRAARRETGQ